MTLAVSGLIHPTAVIGPDAEIAPDVRVGPYVIIEGPVRIGTGCVIEGYACLSGPIEMGRENYVGYKAVLGKGPQSRSYRGEPTRLVIGDGNSFHESVTIHRGTVEGGGLTAIGDGNVLRKGAHLGHDVIMGDGCLLESDVLLAGHVEIGDGCDLASHVVIQQRVRIGRLVRFSGIGGSTKDVPPFVVQEGYNCITGLNRPGLQRVGTPPAVISALGEAFQVLFEEGRNQGEALDLVTSRLGHVPEVREVLEFIRGTRIGINHIRNEERRNWCA
ncbi:acyl-ACP--UDP-N-acetylglucosamine O-acyltransferase [Tautonia plasticadhaerens]|uniref:Acyl-[acyl-carrier-protein]--UDP-N-acetylglucosamine O-acyltransferase n=1 Tax=Tautonia plasticadhaerens TaxID=2527974 RepID=A0A518GYV3_9BACT|nr:acyl-ACP--UDP-N-acetylglucosamine O-acyltransferase [Tautonia plasticadhaerens]QDV33747.1 Acyl-[acyl-carrier-protein]--UDP-N-acetylglucosamine O-acyltransferase [Tautonia plasticadhaerens]